MKIHRICVTSRLDPVWFNRFRSGSHGAVVEADGALTLDGVDLRITEEPPAAGTPVSVWVSGSGHLVCATLADIEHEAQAKRDAEAAQAQRLRQQRNDLRDQALSFNAQFALPVKWNAGVKDVLHGLSSRSWGDGRNSATVAHIHLLEPLNDGRLQRLAGDFLCTSSRSGSHGNGKRWAGAAADLHHDGDGNPYQPMITCRACLTAVARWKASK